MKCQVLGSLPWPGETTENSIGGVQKKKYLFLVYHKLNWFGMNRLPFWVFSIRFKY